jgi:glyoxylase-like metal-dependent hydrolase (beta-lactamase superfamily II)
LAGVTALRFVRRYLGQEVMPVYCFVLGDTLVDSAFPAASRQVQDFARQAGVRRLLLTHHHEDHAGGAAALLAAGVKVLATPMTAALVAQEMPLPFYQHMAWGKMTAVQVEKIEGESVALGPYEAQIIAAPGHAVDQVVFHIAEKGWLFSGDIFIHERVKIFRRDEDFAATIRTLTRILELDFDVLFCGHRPQAEGGREALRRKLQRFQDIEGQTRQLAASGASVDEIVDRVGLAVRGRGFVTVSFGDAAPENLVRSILYGPTPRREVEEVLRAFYS